MRALIALILLLSWLSPVWADCHNAAADDSHSCDNAGAGTCTINYASSQTAGNVNIATILYCDAGCALGPSASVTAADTTGNTYVQKFSSPTAGMVGFVTFVAQNIGAHGAGNTVTFTLTAVHQLVTMNIVECTGIAAAYDVGAAVDTTNTSCTATTATTTVASEIVYAVGGPGTATSGSLDGSYTSLSTTSLTVNGWKSVSSTGTQSATLTQGSNIWCKVHVITLKQTAPTLDTLSFTSQPTNVVSGGTFSPTVVVTISLAGGGTDTGSSAAVTLTIGGCVSMLTGTVTRNAVMGIVTFTGLGAVTADKSCKLTASSSGLVSVDSNTFNVTTTISVVSNTFNVNTIVLAFLVQPTTIFTGGPFSPVVSVSANLSSGGIYTGFGGTISLAISACGGVLTGTLSQPAISGVSTFTGLGAIIVSSGCNLTASSSGTTSSTSSNFDILSACVPAHLVFITQPIDTVIGQSIGLISVTINNADGSICPGATNTIIFSNNFLSCSGMTLSGTTSIAANNGMASVVDLVESAVGICRLDASSTGITGATSLPFQVFPIRDGGRLLAIH